jgi:hypothetical protein
MHPVGEKPDEQPSYPAQMLYCPKCHLVQLGLIVDPKILFPAEYPYTSSTTKILRENFAEMYEECKIIVNLRKEDLVIDIGSNDGNLLSNFKGNHKVLGITPEDIGKIAIEKGIPTILDYFKKDVVEKIKKEYGKALLLDIKKQRKKIYGVGAPSRASTLINYVGIDEGIMDYVMEIKGSHKIGKYVPGTLIPVVEESKLYEDQPEYALLLSWHIAEELAPKLREKGFKGDFIVPLPTPRILKLR